MQSTIASNRSGRQSTCSSVPGRFFFMWMGIQMTSRAPAAKSLSITYPNNSGFMSSMLVSVTTIRSCSNPAGALRSDAAGSPIMMRSRLGPGSRFRLPAP